MTRTVNSNLKSVASKKMCVKPPLSIVDPRNTSHFHKNGKNNLYLSLFCQNGIPV